MKTSAFTQYVHHYTNIDFNEVDIRIYLPEKVIISLLRVDKPYVHQN